MGLAQICTSLAKILISLVSMNMSLANTFHEFGFDKSFSKGLGKKICVGCLRRN